MPIPLPNLSSTVLKKVLEWCEHHKKDPEPVPEENDDTRKKTTEISEWDTKCAYCLPLHPDDLPTDFAIRQSSPSTRRCSLRSSSPPTTSTLNPSCQSLLPRPTPFRIVHTLPATPRDVATSSHQLPLFFSLPSLLVYAPCDALLTLVLHSQRRRMQDRRQHDQGQAARGDSKALQHRQRFHPRRRGADQEGGQSFAPRSHRVLGKRWEFTRTRY